MQANFFTLTKFTTLYLRQPPNPGRGEKQHKHKTKQTRQENPRKHREKHGPKQTQETHKRAPRVGAPRQEKNPDRLAPYTQAGSAINLIPDQ